MTATDSEKIDWSILSVIVIGTFMAVLLSSIVNVALPKMMIIFSASASQIQWILTAYLLVMGVMMPLAGYLGDTFGYKRVYCLALAVFTLGSAFCAISWNLNSIIVARVIQATGGGLIQPIGMTIIYQTYPREKIGQVLGIWGIAAMAAPAIGPTLGGYLVEYVSWRWMFIIIVPMGIVCYSYATSRLKETPLVKGHHFDLAGLVLSMVGFFTLLMALSNGNKDGWASPFIVSLLVTSGCSLCYLVYHELRHPEPIMAFRLLGNYHFSLSILVGSALSMGMFGATFLMPIFLQNVLGLSAMDSGLMMFPAALGAAVAMPIGGRIFDKFGARWVVIPGMMVITWTTYLMAGFSAATAFSAMILIMVVRNVGMGLAMMPVMTAGMNAIPNELVGRASSISNVMRQIAASVGIAMFTSIMQSKQSYHLQSLAGNLNLNSMEMHDLTSALQSIATSFGLDSSGLQYLSLSVLYKQIAQLSSIYAINDCFHVAAAICAVATVLSLFMKEIKKKPDKIFEEEELILLESAIE